MERSGGIPGCPGEPDELLQLFQHALGKGVSWGSERRSGDSLAQNKEFAPHAQSKTSVRRKRANTWALDKNSQQTEDGFKGTKWDYVELVFIEEATERLTLTPKLESQSENSDLSSHNIMK